MGDSLINTNVPMVTTSKIPIILAKRCNNNRYNTSPAFFYHKLAIFPILSMVFIYMYTRSGILE